MPDLSKFRKAVEEVINRSSLENGSHTPDWVLAEYLANCLLSFDTAVNAREKWYGRPHQPSANFDSKNLAAPDKIIVVPISDDYVPPMVAIDYASQTHDAFKRENMAYSCSADEATMRVLKEEHDKLFGPNWRKPFQEADLGT